MDVGIALELMLLFGMFTLALLTYIKNDRKK
ncbi:putative holin-like toxin [Paenilisteria weihenstephanensis]|nr:putative holin-like toxin [Listeria weihenstephanensis]